MQAVLGPVRRSPSRLTCTIVPPCCSGTLAGDPKEVYWSRIVLERAPNFPDLGGHRTADGNVVRSGVVFRSGHLANLTDTDLQQLEDAGIKTIVNFRPEMEREMSGHDRLPKGARYAAISIGDPAAAPHVKRAFEHGDFTVLPDLAAANRALIRNFAAELGQLLKMISKEDNLPVVFHCIGGKDRTGMAAATFATISGSRTPTSPASALISSNRRFSAAP